MKFNTYTNGITFKTNRIITKNDIISICKSLNSRDEYKNICEFKPEGVSEGGIVFDFKEKINGYKSVRLCVRCGSTNGIWYWVNNNVMNEWYENNDIIFNANTKFTIFLKSNGEAPAFTIDELRIWEECFNQCGIVKVGKYPSKKSLINTD